MRKISIALTLMAFVALTATSPLAEEGKFPHRSDFPEVKAVETDQLYDGLVSGDFVVVDVRSKLEFDVIHVDEAQHAAVSKKTFAGQFSALVEANPGKKFAFYCNGITCLKSYKATQKAMAAGFDNVYAYDAGIPEWARTYPEKTLLLDKVITDPEEQLIKKSAFKDKALAWSYFKAASEQGNVMVIDLRDSYQKSGALPSLQKVRNIPLDVFIPNFVAKKSNQDKTLLIFDQVGKQVKWLQYYLEEYGYTDYLFLEGGATKVLKSQNYKS